MNVLKGYTFTVKVDRRTESWHKYGKKNPFVAQVKEFPELEERGVGLTGAEAIEDLMPILAKHILLMKKKGLAIPPIPDKVKGYSCRT